MIGLVEAPDDLKCFFCNDSDSMYRFGEYGKGICAGCIEALREMLND